MVVPGFGKTQNFSNARYSIHGCVIACEELNIGIPRYGTALSVVVLILLGGHQASKLALEKIGIQLP
jgi:hypothetical protein